MHTDNSGTEHQTFGEFVLPRRQAETSLPGLIAHAHAIEKHNDAHFRGHRIRQDRVTFCFVVRDTLTHNR